jgi:hypothetical protein
MLLSPSVGVVSGPLWGPSWSRALGVPWVHYGCLMRPHVDTTPTDGFDDPHFHALSQQPYRCRTPSLLASICVKFWSMYKRRSSAVLCSGYVSFSAFVTHERVYRKNVFFLRNPPYAGRRASCGGASYKWRMCASLRPGASSSARHGRGRQALPR